MPWQLVASLAVSSKLLVYLEYENVACVLQLLLAAAAIAAVVFPCFCLHMPATAVGPHLFYALITWISLDPMKRS